MLGKLLMKCNVYSYICTCFQYFVDLHSFLGKKYRRICGFNSIIIQDRLSVPSGKVDILHCNYYYYYTITY